MAAGLIAMPVRSAICCCDTSFLFSLYGNDANTPAALAETARLRQALTLSALNQFELENALRFAEFRRALPPGKAAAYLADFEADKAAGRVVLVRCSLAPVLGLARRLSARHTLSGGHRAFDVLHVAAALRLKAGHFLSFDANQRALAKVERLSVGP